MTKEELLAQIEEDLYLRKIQLGEISEELTGYPN